MAQRGDSSATSAVLSVPPSPARPGRHFLQIPGPTNVPDEVLAAIGQPTIDHRGPAFAQMLLDLLPRLARVFGTSGDVVIYTASGTGAWEAALVNCLSPGDRVLAFDIGHFSAMWAQMARRLGLDVEVVAGDWRSGVDPETVAHRLAQDRGHEIRAVMVVHNETSTGVTSRVADVRRAIDAAEHPALLLVDAISSLASLAYRHDEWGVDVTVAGSQKGLMLPPGLSFNAVSARAREAAGRARTPRSYWDWLPIIEANRDGFFPYTPATNLLYGLATAIEMLERESLDAVAARHHRHGQATRTAVEAWGLEILCRDPREYSDTLTAVVLPDGHDADLVREVLLERLDISLGTGLGRLRGRVFRIGHLGSFNDLMLCGTLAGVELGLILAGVPIRRGGVQAGIESLLGDEACAQPSLGSLGRGQ